MNVAQRGTSSTSSGYQTVDRFKTNYSGLDNNPTQAQVDVASGATPYTQGFRKAIKITNGNQSSGAGAGDQASISYLIEDQFDQIYNEGIDAWKTSIKAIKDKSQNLVNYVNFKSTKN